MILTTEAERNLRCALRLATILPVVLSKTTQAAVVPAGTLGAAAAGLTRHPAATGSAAAIAAHGLIRIRHNYQIRPSLGGDAQGGQFGLGLGFAAGDESQGAGSLVAGAEALPDGQG